MIDNVTEVSSDFRDKHPSGIGEVDDVAAGAVYLLSDASKYVVGTALHIDGGYCAQ